VDDRSGVEVARDRALALGLEGGDVEVGLAAGDGALQAPDLPRALLFEVLVDGLVPVGQVREPLVRDDVVDVEVTQGPMPETRTPVSTPWSSQAAAMLSSASSPGWSWTTT
jgi:hypothetical protein